MSLATVLLCLLAALVPLAVSAQSNWFQLAWAQLPFTGSNPPGRFSSACAWNAVKSQLFCAGGSTGPVGDFNEMRDMWYDAQLIASGIERSSFLISFSTSFWELVSARRMWDGTTGAWQPADTDAPPFAPQRAIGTTTASLALLGDTYYLFGGQVWPNFD